MYKARRKRLKKKKTSLTERMKVRKKVGRELLGLMKSHGVSKCTLAKRMGASPSAAAQLLTGRQNLTIDSITEFAHHLGYIPRIEFLQR